MHISSSTELEPSLDAARGSERWSWLAGTYWYVPAAYLPAILLLNNREVGTKTVQDQTLWRIESYEAGYIIGTLAISVENRDFSYYALLGSVTPEGEVMIGLFSRDGDSDGNISTGIGRMALADGKWAFRMQMITGSTGSGVAHWAYMVQSTPDDPSWSNIPGVPGTTIDEVFAKA